MPDLPEGAAVLMAARALYAQAACLNADPVLFDAVTHESAHEALQMCRRCPVKTECLMVVAPARNHFDGVVGGLIWFNGKKIRGQAVERSEPVTRFACGTPWGYEKHRRSGEYACANCLEAVRERRGEYRHRGGGEE